MKLLQFAVASIVDANTGYGLGSGSNGDQIRNHQTSVQRGREIRAKSLIAVFGAIKEQIGQVISSYRARAAYNRDVKQILNLNDYLLKDIGLDRSDLAGLKLGLTTLDELDQRRRSSQLNEVTRIEPVSRVSKEIRRLSAANQADSSQVNCA